MPPSSYKQQCNDEIGKFDFVLIIYGYDIQYEPILYVRIFLPNFY